MRIGFDLDGVLADMELELDRQAEALFGDAAAENDLPAVSDQPSDLPPPPPGSKLTPRQQRKLWRHVATIEDFWSTLAEIEPGVIERLAALAGERRWEIIFLTKRPETAGSTAQVQSQRWLQSKGFPLPSVYVVQGSRGRIADALDLHVVIDDRPENCLDVVTDSKARAILVWRNEEKPAPPAARQLGIGSVKSVADCLEVLVELDGARDDRPGVLDRVRRLLGLKTHAPAI